MEQTSTGMPGAGAEVDLARAFRGAGDGPQVAGAPEGDDAALGAALRRMFEDGQRAWPGVGLTVEAFVRHIASRGVQEGAIGALHAADLYLACACEARVRGAVEAFEGAYLGQVGAFLSRMRPSAEAVDEVRQVLREKILVGRGGATAKIAEYDGRGALASWVRVIALRAAIDLRRRGRVAARVDAGGLEARAVADPETSYLKRRYRGAFQDALRGAVRALDADQREILRLHFVDGVPLERQAELLGVHRATVARRVAAARRAIKEGACLRLRAGLGVSEGELASVIRLVRSQLDMSLPGLLKEA